VAAFADGVIVGSALVRCVLDAPDMAAAERRLRALSTELAEGVRLRAPL
jgi:tryptophan synthase alpha chain